MDFSKIETKDLIVEVYYLSIQTARVQERIAMLNQEIGNRPAVEPPAEAVNREFPTPPNGMPQQVVVDQETPSADGKGNVYLDGIPNGDLPKPTM